MYSINCEELVGIKNQIIQPVLSMNAAQSSGVNTAYKNITRGDHSADAASAVSVVSSRLVSENTRIKKVMSILQSASDQYLSAEQILAQKAVLGTLIIRNWDQYGVGTARAFFEVELTPAEIANLGGIDLLEEYQQRACAYTKYDLNKHLFIGYGNIGFLADGWDAAKVTFFNFFDIGETQIESLITGKNYDYSLTRDTIESLLEDYVDYNKNPLEKIFGSKTKDAFKLVKASGKCNEVIEKFLEGDYFHWDDCWEAFTKGEPGTVEFLREMAMLSGNNRALAVFDQISDFAEVAKAGGTVVKYGGWITKIATPLITDYANHIEALEAMKDCSLFGDTELTNRVIDDLISDYSQSSKLAMKALERIAAEEGFDAVVKMLDMPLGEATGVSGGLAAGSIRISAVGAVVKGVDLAIDVTGILTGQKGYTADLQEYFKLTELRGQAENSFAEAFTKLQSGHYTEADVTNFENSFSLNRAVNLRMCKTELSIIESKYGKNPTDSEAAYNIDLLNRHITQLENMKVDDMSTWLQSNGTDISKYYNK